MDTKNYEYIITTAEYGNISNAAKALYITQPALSKAIMKIEENLNVKIFEKKKGKLTPTSAGKILIKSGAEILNIEKNYKYELDEINNCERGALSVSITPTRDLYILPIVLPEFRKIFPYFDIEINEKGIDAIEESLLNKESKIGMYITDTFNKNLQYEVLQQEEILICLSKNSKYLKYVENKKGFKFPWIDLRVLKNEIFFISNPYKAKLGRFANIYFEEYNIKPKTMIIKNMETRLSLASIGEGITFSYEIGSTFSKKNNKNLVFLSVGKEKKTSKFVVSYLKDLKLNTAYRKFIEITKEQFR